jgi:transcriptional regulator GlxA family with amidase domain
MMQPPVALHNCRECQSFGRKGQLTIPKATNEIGIVLYPGVQAASVHGFTDLFGIAGKIALSEHPDPRLTLRVTHWQAGLGCNANPACVYDSDPSGSPKPQILIIPPTMVNLPSPDVPPGVVSWLRRHYAGGAKLVSVCSAAFILAETGLAGGRSVSTHQICAEALAERPKASANSSSE